MEEKMEKKRGRPKKMAGKVTLLFCLSFIVAVSCHC
jgi:hypothetical protein